MRGVSLPTGDRIYAAVKRELLSGDVLPGERLDAALLAGRHVASITPVRAALHRLVGEGLVVAEAGEGFHTPRVSEASLRALYIWNGRCLQLAWQLASARGPSVDAATGLLATGLAGDLDVTTRTDQLFAAIGALAGLEPCATAIAALSDRLHVPRRVEARLFADAAAEWADLAATLTTGRSRPLHDALGRYHRRRQRAAPELVHMMHGGGPAE